MEVEIDIGGNNHALRILIATYVTIWIYVSSNENMGWYYAALCLSALFFLVGLDRLLLLSIRKMLGIENDPAAFASLKDRMVTASMILLLFTVDGFLPFEILKWVQAEWFWNSSPILVGVGCLSGYIFATSSRRYLVEMKDHGWFVVFLSGYVGYFYCLQFGDFMIWYLTVPAIFATVLLFGLFGRLKFFFDQSIKALSFDAFHLRVSFSGFKETTVYGITFLVTFLIATRLVRGVSEMEAEFLRHNLFLLMLSGAIALVLVAIFRPKQK